MSKAVLISIQPKWCEKIASDEKTVEVRKSRPKLETPFKCYIYCTKGGRGLVKGDVATTVGYIAKNGGKVIGEFVCDEIRDFKVLGNGDIQDYYYADLDYSCLDASEIGKYIGTGRVGYSWGISKLVIYDKPKLLSEFYKECAGLDNTGLCWECENASGEECDCAVNGRLYLTRPPQSWCYVEELITI